MNFLSYYVILLILLERFTLFSRELKRETVLSRGRLTSQGELFFYITCLHIVPFIFLSIFLLAETISLKI